MFTISWRPFFVSAISLQGLRVRVSRDISIPSCVPSNLAPNSSLRHCVRWSTHDRTSYTCVLMVSSSLDRIEFIAVPIIFGWPLLWPSFLLG